MKPRVWDGKDPIKRCVAYVRVSTDGQTKEDRFGIECQKDIIGRYCFDNDISIVKWYIDEGESGAKPAMDRPKMAALLQDSSTANPPIDYVICAKTDRIARDIYIYYAVKSELQRRNVELISVTEDFGNMGTFAPICEAMVAAMAQLERDMITMRTKGGRDKKAQLGGYAGGRPPFGYVVINHKLVIEPTQAKSISLMFALNDAGAKLWEICEALHVKGYKNGVGNDFEPAAVRKIISNRKLYEGFYRYGKNEWRLGAHQPILLSEGYPADED